MVINLKRINTFAKLGTLGRLAVTDITLLVGRFRLGRRSSVGIV